ncbi:MAG: RagB/SusD family nutrient uptake outer membrane protein [Chitinophagaceae bacterium]
MKNIKYYKFFSGLFLSIMIVAGCKKDFLQKPPTDAIVDVNFYKTDDQVLAATSLLYNKVWFDYNSNASYAIGDFRGGSAYSVYNNQDNVRFNTTGVTNENGASWRSFFIVVGQSNLAIQNIEKYAGNAVSPGIKKMGIAEARFMRALAYRYLVMNWGPVPIITNNLNLLSDTSISTNTVPSIWRFITNEMRATVADLPETPVRPGRLTKWSAEGMLARFYLTRAGVEANGSGTRNQTFLDSAKYYADDVIKNSGNQLLKNYADLFLFPYDNNAESLFSLQWVYVPGSYGTQNTAPTFLAYSPDIANGDGYGGDFSATWWMLKQYDGFDQVGGIDPVIGDTLMRGRTLDQRLKATFMLPGFYYPEITQSLHNPEGKQKLIFPYRAEDRNYTSIKKYVTGKAEDVGGQSAKQNYGNDTYMLRLAEMYLTYAEAVLGNTASTADPLALQYFNKVHTRAGLPAFINPLTADVLFKERIIEFAMEGMSWYDLVNLHYYNKAKAYSILNNQDRGLMAVIPDQFPNPTLWTIRKTSWARTNRFIVANDGNFVLPIPTAELSQAPNLLKTPVDFYK